jgi:hypothetical protein
MPKTNSREGEKRAKPKIDRTGERSSPGSGEDETEAADLQPEDVENADSAR